MDTVSDLRPYICEVCSLGFKTHQFLKRHMSSHSDLRPYRCEFCNNTYKYKKGLNRHIKNNHSEKWSSLSKTKRQNFAIKPREHDIDRYLALDDSIAMIPNTKIFRIKHFVARVCLKDNDKLDE
ncbi:unnamed protein product [Blepharisma stoltei]|uniref:C2H2-type domain-containing protein n=1 Tax=Blepharisma stoltei TaxID=1481888 RepID=A0AAU9KBI1_9CILI|nr:unnamed protein product [Blepharisma stoltei]